MRRRKSETPALVPAFHKIQAALVKKDFFAADWFS
jgi:hypothetical protein